MTSIELRRANCAGQGCAERESCKRYRLRVLVPRDERKETADAPWVWITADVEREFFGDCALKVEFDERKVRRAA